MCKDDELETPKTPEHREHQRLMQKKLKYGWTDKDYKKWYTLRDFVLSDEFLQKYDLPHQKLDK